jgi:hypothetical protein
MSSGSKVKNLQQPPATALVTKPVEERDESRGTDAKGLHEASVTAMAAKSPQEKKMTAVSVGQCL